jgi:hypothetical protein
VEFQKKARYVDENIKRSMNFFGHHEDKHDCGELKNLAEKLSKPLPET